MQFSHSLGASLTSARYVVTWPAICITAMILAATLSTSISQNQIRMVIETTLQQSVAKLAEKMFLRALQGFEKARGPEHTSTLDTVNTLGNLYAGLGRFDEAESLLHRALHGFKKSLGPGHTSTLNTVDSLGEFYQRVSQVNKTGKTCISLR